MILTLEDWKNGWVGVEVELSVPEIDKLIRLLEQVKADPEQHFHLESEYQGEGGVGMITFRRSYTPIKERCVKCPGCLNRRCLNVA